MQNIRQQVVSQRRNQHMYMIRHYEKLMKPVTLAIEFLQRVFDQFSRFFFGKLATAMPCIQPVLQAVWKQLIVFLPGCFIMRFGVFFPP